MVEIGGPDDPVRENFFRLPPDKGYPPIHNVATVLETFTPLVVGIIEKFITKLRC